MSPTLRQEFLNNPHASKKLINVTKKHQFPLKNLLPEEERVIVYLQHFDSLFLPEPADDLINMICHETNKNATSAEQIGFEKGEHKGKLEVAKEMLAEGCDPAFVAKITKLPIEKIKEIQKNRDF